VTAFLMRPVIARENDQGIFSHTHLFNAIQQAANLQVIGFQHFFESRLSLPVFRVKSRVGTRLRYPGRMYIIRP
jgi:hypothetical protein